MSTEVRAVGRRPGAPPRREIRALTGLRAVAATWVVLYHVSFLSAAYLDQLPFLRPVLEAGWTGVELFFVLSGFVIARSYLDDMGRWRTGASLRFLYNRLARVWPTYALVTVVAFAWLSTITELGWYADVMAPHPEATAGELGRQLSMSQMWGEERLTGQSFNPPGWSISAEWLAYLAFPVLALLLKPLRHLPAAVLLLLGCAAMLPLFLNSYLHGTTDVDTDWLLRISCCFVAGVLACLAARRLQDGPRAEQWGLTLSVTSGILILLVCYWAHWRALLQPGDYAGVITLLYPLLIAGLSLSDRGPSRFLSSGPLVYGGRISYALYLVHFVVLDVVVTSVWQDETRRATVPPELALGIPLIVLGSMALAAVLHHGVEEPARRWMLSLLPARRPAPGPATGPGPDTGSIPAAELLSRLEAMQLPTERVGAGARAAAARPEAVATGSRRAHRAS